MGELWWLALFVRLAAWRKEFNTIAVDDGIAMGHDGMLYSLPSRDLIADSVEYMVNAHRADALVMYLELRQDHPRHALGSDAPEYPHKFFVSGGPMESGEGVEGVVEHRLDLVDAMVMAVDDSVSDTALAQIEKNACPHVWFLCGYVYRKLHELPERGDWSGVARQRYHACDPDRA